MKLITFMLAIPALFGMAQAEVKTQVVEYKEGTTILEGYLAYDNALSGKRPGVLIAHEWTGLGDYVKGRAEQLAKYGGAVHSFTNPASGNDSSKGAANNAAADRRSWEAMKQLFAEIFRP